MAEKKGVGHAYNVDFLNVVFAASSVFLFLSVIWMVWDDYDRDWKNTQRRFVELEYQVTQASLEQAARGVDPNKLTQLQAAARGGPEERRGEPAEGRRARGQMAEVDARLYRESQDYQFAKATYDQDRYDFEAARAAGASDAERKGRGGQRSRSSGRTSCNLQLEKTTAERNALQQQLDDSSPAKSGKVQKQIDEMNAEQKPPAARRLRVLAPSVVEGLLPRTRRCSISWRRRSRSSSLSCRTSSTT